MKSDTDKNIMLATACYHCGDDCTSEDISFEDKLFCCEGCKMVFQILNENGLCSYYNIESNPSPGIKLQSRQPLKKFEFLDDEFMKKRLISFSDENISKVNFFIPAMHCSSCLWLLENLFKINSGIMRSSVNFLQRTVSIIFNHNEITLRGVVELLSKIGYEPKLKLETAVSDEKKSLQRSLYYKVGIAGFAHGNIMMLTFPVYLSIDQSSLALKDLFSWLILFISLPVFFYCSSDYFVSAYKALRSKYVNIDVPLALGIVAFYVRSLIEIFSSSGPGFMDSFTGLIFFLLLGKLFQNKTFERLNFERNYSSYFPISVTTINNAHEKSIPLERLNIGDKFLIKNNELIPVDSILTKGVAQIDYSFITGESAPIIKQMGELLFAGGKHFGSAIELTATKNVSQSYLTQLWNDSAIKHELKKTLNEFSTVISKYFTFVLIMIAIIAGIYWSTISLSVSLSVVTSVLIIACPCALALSVPFALGNVLRIFSRNSFFVKSTKVVEHLSKIDTIVFDKTGTITQSEAISISFTESPLSEYEAKLLSSLTKHSTHPLSNQIHSKIKTGKEFEVNSFLEVEGKGIEGFIDGHYLRLGSLKYVGKDSAISPLSEPTKTCVYLAVDNNYRGMFTINQLYRDGIKELIQGLKSNYEIIILSGDLEIEKESLTSQLETNVEMHFEQSPFQKLEFIQKLQNEGKTVLMIGDGLNDAGALKQSDVAVSVTENTLNFTPASDAIISGGTLNSLINILKLSNDSVLTIKLSFMISLVYNTIGLTYACKGLITPLFATILMPISSVTVILFTMILTSVFAKKRGLKI